MFVLGWQSGRVYYVALLFFAAMGWMGLIQAIAGRHMLTKR